MRSHIVIDLVLFTVQDNTNIANELGVPVPGKADLGKWVWIPTLQIVGFIFKGHSKIRDMGPNYYSILDMPANNWAGAMERALKLELKRIASLDIS